MKYQNAYVGNCVIVQFIKHKTILIETVNYSEQDLTDKNWLTAIPGLGKMGAGVSSDN